MAVNNPNIEIITDDRLLEKAFDFWHSNDDPAQQ